MGSLQLATEIDAPPDRVFMLISDLEGVADRVRSIDSVELLTDGPFGEGTRWRETRTLMGHSATEELEVIRFDPRVGYTTACQSCGCSYESSFRCEAHDDATRLVLTLEWRALTLLAKLFSPFSALAARSMRKGLEQDLVDLKRAAESESV